MPVWGMVIESSKRYKQVVERPYKITRAVLSNAKKGDGDCQFLLNIGGTTFIACILNADTPQCALDLQFTAGDSITLLARADNKCEVHVTGYITDGQATAAKVNGSQQGAVVKAEKNKDNSKQKNKDLKKLLEKTMSDSDSDDMDFSQLLEGEDSDDDELLGDDEEDSDEMGDDEEGDEEEDEDGEEEEDDDEDGEEEDDDEEEDSEAEEEVKPPPSKKKKENAKPQQEQQQKKNEKQEKQQKDAAQTNGKAPTASVGKEQSLAGGVRIKDVKEGTGAFAKPGKTVAVYYVGRLQGKNKIFDSCSQGAGFKFQLGRGVVIRGWDTGIAGMRVGGKRQIICPPNVAYGARGQPPVIPPNSTLVFDVELRNVS